jgi:hypothetical protein
MKRNPIKIKIPRKNDFTLVRFLTADREKISPEFVKYFLLKIFFFTSGLGSGFSKKPGWNGIL